jgi:hypothetical protein
MKDNFRERMQSKLKASGHSGRTDLELHDVKVIESGTAATVLATYSDLRGGPPSVWDIQSWLTDRMGAFASHVQARLDTVRAYPESSFITFVVEQKRLRQPMSAAKGMTKAGIDQFLDEGGQLWEVVQADEGPNYILRKEGTSIEEMLDVRKASLRGSTFGRKTVTLAAVDSIPSAGGGFAAVDIGDTVDFYHNGAIHRGKVGSAGAAGVKVTTVAGGGTYTIDPAAITSVVEKSAGSVKEDDDITRRYFSNVYPGNPEMTAIISPTSTAPITDNRPPPGEEPLKGIETVASARTGRVSGSVRPFVPTSK